MDTTGHRKICTSECAAGCESSFSRRSRDRYGSCHGPATSADERQQQQRRHGASRSVGTAAAHRHDSERQLRYVANLQITQLIVRQFSSIYPFSAGKAANGGFTAVAFARDTIEPNFMCVRIPCPLLTCATQCDALLRWRLCWERSQERPKSRGKLVSQLCDGLTQWNRVGMTNSLLEWIHRVLNLLAC